MSSMFSHLYTLRMTRHLPGTFMLVQTVHAHQGDTRPSSQCLTYSGQLASVTYYKATFFFCPFWLYTFSEPCRRVFAPFIVKLCRKYEKNKHKTNHPLDIHCGKNNLKANIKEQSTKKPEWKADFKKKTVKSENDGTVSSKFWNKIEFRTWENVFKLFWQDDVFRQQAETIYQ